MSFNPYAPPEHHPETPSPAGGAGGAPQDFGIEEVVRSGWEIVQQHWVALIFGPLIGAIIGNIPGQILGGIGGASRDKDLALVMTVAGTLVGYVVQTFFTAGALRMYLTAARGGAPQVGQIFSGGSAYGRLLGTTFLVSLAVLVGFVLLIVPGVILALGFSLAPYYAVDTEKGPIEAMQASWKATDGRKGQLLLFGLLGLALAILGLLACCVGAFVAQAVIGVGHAIIFVRLSGRMAGGPPSPFGGPPSPYMAGGGGFTPGGSGAGPTPPPGGGWGAA